MTFRRLLPAFLAALSLRKDGTEGEIVEPSVRTLTNTDGAMPFTNVARVHEPRAHSIKKELKRDLQAEKMTGRQWKKLRKQMRRGMNDA